MGKGFQDKKNKNLNGLWVPNNEYNIDKEGGQRLDLRNKTN